MGKKLVITAFLLLLGGGAAAVSVVAAGGKAVAAPAVSRPGAFFKLDPITISALRGDGVRRTVTLVVTLELESGRLHEEITPHIPRLEDAFVTELSGLLGYNWPGGATLDLDFARKRLLARSERLLGAELVDRILFTFVQERTL